MASDQSARVEAIQLPAGATLDSSGNLTWVPKEDQSGQRKIATRVHVGDEDITYEFSIKVATPRRQRTQVVDPEAPTSTTVTVDAPLSPIRGAAVQLEPGSLGGGEQVALSISSLDDAPVPPVARLGRVPAEELKPVEFGPAGTAFLKPARAQLPVSPMVLKRGRPAVVTINPATGAWERVKLLKVDEEQGLVTAEIKHFSTYVVVPEVPLIDGKLSRGGAGTACENSLMVRAPLAMALGELPGDTVNGFSGQAATLADVLAGLKAGQAIQVFVQAVAESKEGKEEGWLLVSAIKDEGGKFKVAVTSSKHPVSFLKVPDLLDPTDPQFLALLSGKKAHLIFGGLGSLSEGVTVTVETSIYVVDGADASHPPVNAVNPVAREVFEGKMLSSDLPNDPGYDTDCDQAPDSDNPEPNGEPPPRLVAEPASPVHVTVGAAAKLTVMASAPDVIFTWTGSDPALGPRGRRWARDGDAEAARRLPGPGGGQARQGREQLRVGRAGRRGRHQDDEHAAGRPHRRRRGNRPRR